MKYTLTVQETQVYMHEVVIETDDDIEDVCDNLEEDCESAEDIMDIGGNYYTPVEYIQDGSPECSIEIIDYQEGNHKHDNLNGVF